MQYCCYSEVQKADSQETMSMRQDSVADGPQENNGCSLESRSTARISVQEWARRASQIPRWVTKLTVSTEWDLFSRMGKFSVCSIQSASSTGEEIRPLPSGEATMRFGRGWNNLWQISDLSNRRSKRLQVSRPYGTPLNTSSVLEGHHRDTMTYTRK